MAEELTRVVSKVNDNVISFKYAKVKPDVCVNTPLNEYRLHSQILQICSPWFANSFTDACWGVVEDSHIPDSPTFKYEYCFDESKDGSYMLAAGKKKKGSGAEEPTMIKACEALGNIFNCFYRQSLVFSPSPTPRDFISLINTAEKYGALEVCTAAIQSALFNIVDIDEKVCKSPVSYLLIAYKVESAMLFREAFVHTVGQWHLDNFPDAEDDLVLPKEIVKLVKVENKRLLKMVVSTTRSLLSVNTNAYRSWSKMKCGFARILVLDEVNKAFIDFSAPGKEGMLFTRLNDFQSISKIYAIETHDEFCSTTKCPAKIYSWDPENDTRNDRLNEWIKTFLCLSVKDLVKVNLRSNTKARYLTCANITDDMMPWLVVES
ncbi:hypothetical protein RUND412_002850 [Rhizina undulata]